MAKKKRTATKKRSTKKQPEMKSFRVYPNPGDFSKMRFTRQTVYWLILVTFIVITQLWILKLQIDISDLTNTLTTIVNG